VIRAFISLDKSITAFFAEVSLFIVGKSILYNIGGLAAFTLDHACLLGGLFMPKVSKFKHNAQAIFP